jgi:LemA protein
VNSIYTIAGCFFIFALYMMGVDARWLWACGAALGAWTFNTKVHASTQAQNAYSTIGVMLKKRYDLIPALVDTVQRYVEHEEQVFEEVTRLRARASVSGVSAQEAVEIDQQMGRALNQLIATAEAYPELKANQGFQDMQHSLNEVEEQISAARRSYNMSVKHYNDSVRMLPTSLFALIMRYEQMPYFELPKEHAQPHDVMARFRSNERD